jgi:hypothetical protein
LVGAIPGAFLAGLMVMAFLNYAGGPSMGSKLLAGMALLVGVLLTCMPVGIFVYGGPKAEKAPKEKSADEAEIESGEGETIIAESDEGSDSHGGMTDSSLEVVEGEPDEFAMTGEIVHSDAELSNEEFAADSDFEVGTGDEAVEMIDEEDEFGDDAPKKKK